MKYLEDDYLSNQHSSLNNEIATLLNETRILERQCTIASLGIGAWILTQKSSQSGLKDCIIWIPLLISFLGCIRCYTIGRAVKRAANYLMIIEKNIEKSKDTDFVGWEHYIRNEGKDTKLWLSAIIYWIILNLINAFLVYISIKTN